MKYPLTLSFKILALAPQIHITDADGKTLMYVRQKLFKLKEHVEVFSDSQRTDKIFDIKANRVIDWSASYQFTQADGAEWGLVRRRGAKSIWRATYEICDEDGQHILTLSEESVWKKVLDSLVGEIPFIGFALQMLINPSYVITRSPDETPVMRLDKRPSIFERRFIFHKLVEMETDDELRCMLSTIMMALLERGRG